MPEPLPFSRVGLRKARLERETWTCFALLYLHNGRGRNQRSAEINVTGLLYVHDFEAIWTFLQGATWIFEPLGVLCLVTSARSKGKSPKSIFVERSGVARSVRNRKLIA